MSSKNDNTKKKALVLSGGGGRGAYHVGVLQFLEEHDWIPDIVVGTSIGAVNGAALASGHNARSLKALWRRLKTKDVQKIRWNPFDKGNSILDTNPLRNTLIEDGWLDFDQINSERAKVALRITATEVSTGKLFVFGNSKDSRTSRMRQIPLTLDHIISSCSIPLVYPATQVDDHVFWDGAVVANTPLGAAIDAGAEEIVVVIMTPHREEQGRLQALPMDLLTSVTMMLDWVLLSSFQAELRTFRSTNQRLALKRALKKYDIGSEKEDKREVEDPIIVSPSTFLPISQIVTYAKEWHEKLFELGYENAKDAWQQSGRKVEGEGSSSLG